MKKIIKALILILTTTVSYAADGVINVGSASILPKPMDIVEDNGVGTFSFNIYESGGLDIPVAASPAQLTIGLSNVDVSDGINSVHGYSTYFNIAIGYPGGVPNVYLQQKAVIPASSNIPITIEVKVTTNSTEAISSNGGQVNLTPGSGQPTGGVAITNDFTYTADLPNGAADPYSLSIGPAKTLIEVGETSLVTFKLGNNGSDPIPVGGAMWDIVFPNIVTVNQSSLNLGGGSSIFSPTWSINGGITNLELTVIGTGIPSGPQEYTMSVDIEGANSGGPSQLELDNSYNTAISQNTDLNNDSANGSIEVVTKTCVNGSIIYNIETNKFNFCENGLWVEK